MYHLHTSMHAFSYLPHDAVSICLVGDYVAASNYLFAYFKDVVLYAVAK